MGWCAQGVFTCTGERGARIGGGDGGGEGERGVERDCIGGAAQVVNETTRVGCNLLRPPNNASCCTCVLLQDRTADCGNKTDVHMGERGTFIRRMMCWVLQFTFPDDRESNAHGRKYCISRLGNMGNLLVGIF